MIALQKSMTSNTPFQSEDLAQPRRDPAGALDHRVSGWRGVFEDRGWRMPDDIQRDISGTPTALPYLISDPGMPYF